LPNSFYVQRKSSLLIGLNVGAAFSKGADTAGMNLSKEK
jgi:hypothetical protein